MRVRNALIAGALALLCTTPAQAQTGPQLIVSGAGFGHGVGMSQWGAFGMASLGAAHQTILAHYYTGTQDALLTAPVTMRVLLKSGGGMTFTGVTGVAGGRHLDPRHSYRAQAIAGGRVALRNVSGRYLGSHRAPLRLHGAADGFLLRGRAQNGISGGRYRGDLEIRPSAQGALEAIDAVDLESYVRGVVAGESPPEWPPEALAAQAVAARTYAITITSKGDGFDQYADQRSQVYGGITAERPSTDAVVAATTGEVVTYQGKPVPTYYFSSSGGRTENIENVFRGALPEPWLVSVDDPFDAASPRHTWTIAMSLDTAAGRLGSLLIGRLRQIKVLSRGASPRIMRAEIIGTGGRTRVSGTTLRSKLGLYDTWATFTVSRSGVATPAPTPPVAPVLTAPGGGTAPP